MQRRRDGVHNHTERDTKTESKLAGKKESECSSPAKPNFGRLIDVMLGPKSPIFSGRLKPVPV